MYINGTEVAKYGYHLCCANNTGMCAPYIKKLPKKIIRNVSAREKQNSVPTQSVFGAVIRVCNFSFELCSKLNCKPTRDALHIKKKMRASGACYSR